LGELEIERDESKIAEELLSNTSRVHRWVKQLCENTQPRPRKRIALACMKSGNADTVIIPIDLKTMPTDKHAICDVQQTSSLTHRNILSKQITNTTERVRPAGAKKNITFKKTI
jgi:hypothetical protein